MIEIERKGAVINGGQIAAACDQGIKSLSRFIERAQRMVQVFRALGALPFDAQIDAECGPGMRQIAAALEWPGAVAELEHMVYAAELLELRIRERIQARA